MAKTVTILNGYRGKATKENFLPAGAVVEVENEVAEALMANGHAKPGGGKATYGISGPLRGENTLALENGNEEARSPEPNARRLELNAMDQKALASLAVERGIAMDRKYNKRDLVDLILDAEAPK